MTDNRVKGHTLVGEGWPLNYRGDRLYTTSQGHARCSCGLASGLLQTNRQRKQWHREHKDAIRAGGAS